MHFGHPANALLDRHRKVPLDNPLDNPLDIPLAGRCLTEQFVREVRATSAAYGG